MSGQVWTDRELAAEWRCKLPWLQKMLRDGTIRGFKAGHDWRIPDSSRVEYESGETAKRAS